MPAPLIYFDNNATTALDPAVVEAMLPYLTDFYGNPSSAYSFGSRVGRALETARARVASLVDCDPSELIFTGSGSEGNNTALHSALQADRDRRHVVTSSVEHSATKNFCDRLARRGFEVTWLPVNSAGLLDLDELRAAVRDDTAVVSLMWANNETGVLFPVHEAAQIARAKGAYFHTDAVQAVGKVPVSLQNSPVHFLSLAGHKLHAPKGVGALYVGRRTRFTPPDRRRQPGGKPPRGHGERRRHRRARQGRRTRRRAPRPRTHRRPCPPRPLRDRRPLRHPGTELNGDPAERLPNTSNLYFRGVEGEALLVLLDKANICASAGSACNAGSIHPSHVLTAMGFPTERARGSLRFSFSRFNTADEVNRRLSRCLPCLRR